MSSRKLSDSDKSDIVELYRQPGETTLTLASRYGVSSSTISRILKSSFSEHEYETLIQEKRSGRVQSHTSQSESASSDVRRKRKRSSVADDSETSSDSGTQLNLLDPEPLDRGNNSDPEPLDRGNNSDPEPLDRGNNSDPEPLDRGNNSDDDDRDDDDLDDDDVDEIYQAEASTLHEMLGEDMLDEDDLDDDEDDDEDDYDDEYEDEPYVPRPRKTSKTLVEVLPLDSAELPRPCYIVVDRGGELITRPLGDFSELGKIALTEFQQRTLPVFDNHRVARRFSNRNQRVIKVPDGEMLQKTASYLEAKGISRLLLDGQVYSL
jgi:transposase-like protein